MRSSVGYRAQWLATGSLQTTFSTFSTYRHPRYRQSARLAPPSLITSKPVRHSFCKTSIHGFNNTENIKSYVPSGPRTRRSTTRPYAVRPCLQLAMDLELCPSQVTKNDLSDGFSPPCIPEKKNKAHPPPLPHSQIYDASICTRTSSVSVIPLLIFSTSSRPTRIY